MIDERYIREFTGCIAFPAEATEELSEAFRLLQSERESFSAFCTLVEQYEKDLLPDGTEFFDRLRAVASGSGVSFYSLQLLYLTALTPRLRELYALHGYGEERFLNSMGDLKWKMLKCKRMYGIWGSFTADWQIDFFRLKIFGIGRLQFELIKSEYDYSDGVHEITKGCDALFVHIPASGRLNHEECLEAYAGAEKFFHRFFPEKFPKGAAIPFITSSWLIYPANRQILSAGTNIIAFMNDFDVFDSFDSTGDLWRIFYRDDYKDNPDEMPCETSLQRAYLKWLKEGNSVGEGIGVFFYRDGRILKGR